MRFERLRILLIGQLLGDVIVYFRIFYKSKNVNHARPPKRKMLVTTLTGAILLWILQVRSVLFLLLLYDSTICMSRV